MYLKLRLSYSGCLIFVWFIPLRPQQSNLRPHHLKLSFIDIFYGHIFGGILYFTIFVYFGFFLSISNDEQSQWSWKDGPAQQHAPPRALTAGLRHVLSMRDRRDLSGTRAPVSSRKRPGADLARSRRGISTHPRFPFSLFLGHPESRAAAAPADALGLCGRGGLHVMRPHCETGGLSYSDSRARCSRSAAGRVANGRKRRRPLVIETCTVSR